MSGFNINNQVTTMKKIFYTLGLLLLAASCTDDYTDWANPQQNEQEEPQTVSLSVSAASAIDFATLTTDRVQLFTPTVTASVPEASTTYDVALSREGSAESVTLDAGTDGRVAAAELQAVVEKFFGKAPEERTLNGLVSAYTNVGDGQSVINRASVQVKATLVRPDISEHYYLVGDFCGWDNESKMQFSHSDTNIYDDPVFTITFTTTGENQYWKVIPQKNIDNNDFWANPGVLGTEIDGDDSLSGKLVDSDAKAGKITTAGKYIMTINVMDMTYSIVPAPTELYMTGSAFGNWSVWRQLTPVWGAGDNYWTIIYCNADDEFKFSAAAGWNGTDFGSSATMIDEAGAGLLDSGGNVKVQNAGWYLIHVVNGDTRSITVSQPKVYLIGETAGEWNVDDSHLFEVPDGNGTFVSPAFAADAELRMCVNLPGFDWWKTEFIILNGKIVYRGNGDDQTRVPVTAGQRAYLNFSTDEGEVK